MAYKFKDIVDVNAIQSLMDKLWQASGIPTGIIDVDGTVLVAAGWQEICSQFHRQNPETDARCRESDAYLTRHLQDFAALPECGYIEYRCGNGLIDIAIPIVIEGRHLANIFLGQFFYDPPEKQFFVEQARRGGFDEEAYLKALWQVPVFSRQKVNEILQFNSSLVNLLIRMGVEKLRQIEVQQELLKSEKKLRTSLEEKEVLLQEIHHRVKNNLQVVSSLLYLQSENFSDPELTACFLESQSRICSMALAHEQLYQTKNLCEIRLKAYVESLVDQLRQAFLLPDQVITCRLEVDDFVLDIEKVIPCGLLITELLSNAYKHAFVDGRAGNITISMHCCAEEMVLAVADDGVGLPSGFDYCQTNTLGMHLMTALANQLNGSLELEQDHGTLFKIRFVP